MQPSVAQLVDVEAIRRADEPFDRRADAKQGTHQPVKRQFAFPHRSAVFAAGRGRAPEHLLLDLEMRRKTTQTAAVKLK